MAGTGTKDLRMGATVHLGQSASETDRNFTGGLLQIHEKISGWEVESKLNTDSGEADIYLASKDGVKGIIKYYHSLKKPKEKVLEALIGFKHEDIINIFECGEYNNRFYEIMEYAEGGALDTRLENGKFKYLPLSEANAVQALKEIINALKDCHAKGIIHRDIKPENLYYRKCKQNEDGSWVGLDVIIGDFGISSVMEEGENIHKTQTFGRTAGYAAPEILVSALITPKMDYYALGITLWELLTAEDPFAQKNGKSRNIAHLFRDTTQGRMARDMLRRYPKVGKSMESLIQGLMVVNPEKRWGYDEVTRHLAGESVPIEQNESGDINFKIGDTVCTSLEDLGRAIMENPEAAKRYVYRGALASYLEDALHDEEEKALIKQITEAAEESSARNKLSQGLMKVAWILNPGLPFSLSGGYEAYNLDDIVSLTANAPEAMLPLIKDGDSPLYVYLESMGYAEYAKGLKAIDKKSVNADILGRAEVILRDGTIKPFKLARYAGFSLSSVDQLEKVPKDMQNRILSFVREKSYEGLLLPWLELHLGVDADGLPAGNWQALLRAAKDTAGAA